MGPEEIVAPPPRLSSDDIIPKNRDGTSHRNHGGPSVASEAAAEPDITADVADDADCPKRTRKSERTSTDYADYTDFPERARNRQNPQGRTGNERGVRGELSILLGRGNGLE